MCVFVCTVCMCMCMCVLCVCMCACVTWYIYTSTLHIYGGPKVCAMRQYLNDSIYATIDNIHVTIDDNYATSGQ